MVGLSTTLTRQQERPRRSWGRVSSGAPRSRWALSLWLLLSPLLLPSSVAAQSAPSDLIPLAVIQGSGPASSFDEQDVTTWGYVTGLTSDGFYLQDPMGDGDPTTSDGIFVYTYNAPTVTAGQCVNVAGEVVEYFAKTELNWLTAITPATGCGEGVTPVTLPLVRPGDDPALTLEAFEGMVVRLDAFQGTVHGPTKRYTSGEEEVAFLPAQWQRTFGPVHLFHDQPAVSALLYLSNRLGMKLPAVRWGDEVKAGESGLVGVLDYNFGKYQLLPIAGQTLMTTAGETRPSTLPPARDDEYGLCTFNLHGFGQGEAQFPDPADYANALRQRAQVIASELLGCTVIALQETGSPEDAQALAELLASEHDLAYTALSLEGPASHEPEFPLTNSLLVDSARVTVEVVDAVQGCAPHDYDIVAPSVCALGEYPLFDRPPLMAQLTIGGPAQAPWQRTETIWVIGNHWKSKSGDESANAQLRAAQANAVAQRVQAILAVDPSAQIVVMGDLNDFYQGAAVATLQSASGLFHPYEWLPALDRYTYIFNGAAQVLDHLLVTPNLTPKLALVQILHLHADSATGDSPLVHSDHDPVVVRVRPNGAAAIGGNLHWAQINVSARDANGKVMAQATTDAHGDYRLWGITMGSVHPQYDAPEWIVLDEPGQTIGALTGLLIAPAPQVRHTTAISGAWLALATPWLADTYIR